MKLFPFIPLVGVVSAVPCFAQFPGVGPALSKEKIIAVVEQIRPQMELLEKYQKRLEELRRYQMVCEAKRTQDDRGDAP